MSNISSIRLSGTTYNLKDNSATTVINITQAEYDALPSSAKTADNVVFNITDATGINVTTAVTSGSTDIITSGGVYNALGGLKMAIMTAAEYAAITPDSSTIYFVGDSNGYVIKVGSTSVN